MESKVFKLNRVSIHTCLVMICFPVFMIPVQLLTVGIVSQLPNGFFFLGIIPMILGMLAFSRLMTDQLEATADAIGFSVKVTKAGWFGSKADMYFTWDALEIFKIVGGKSPNLTMRWVNGSTHSYTGADKDALYAYLKANFPKREHAGWW